MAAGIVYQTVTTTTGETIEMAFWVDNTAAPTTWKPVSVMVNSSGAEIAAVPVGPNTSSNSTPIVGATDWTPAVVGSVAHDTADSGAPVKNGFKATTALSGLTLVANADRTDGFAGVDGVQIVRPYCNLEDIVTQTPVGITDGTSTTIIPSQGAGVKFYLTSITIANSSATAVTVNLRDGAAGAVKWTFPVPANTSGVVYSFPVPLPFAAATAMCAHPSAAATTITVSAVGFKSKV